MNQSFVNMKGEEVMKRITPEQAEEIFEALKMRPISGIFWRDEGDGKAGCCIVTAIVLREKGLNQPHEHMPFLTEAINLGYHRLYICGVMNGFDGKTLNHELHKDHEYLVGFEDGQLIKEKLQPVTMMF